MPTDPAIFAAWMAQTGNPLTTYWHHLVDPTFRGLYQANAFDFSIMLPYFLVMAILAMYGMHRYVLVYHFYKNRKNAAGAAPEITEWPKVTVQLPIFNERYVIERLVEAVAKFRLPGGAFLKSRCSTTRSMRPPPSPAPASSGIARSD